MNYRNEIDRLLQIDYGYPHEIFVQVSVLIGVAIAMYTYNGTPLGAYWVFSFLATDALYFFVLKSRPQVCTSRDYTYVGAAILISLVVFLSLPVYFATLEDLPLKVAGFLTLGLAMMIIIRRADTGLWLVLSEISLVILASLYASTGLAFIMTNTAATAVVGIAGLGFLGYFAEVALAHRKSRLDAHLASQRSIQAQKMEATGQLVGGVAHDFNNILTAVIGNLELYSEVDLAQDKDHFVAEARSSAMIAAKLIKQLMAYSRLSILEASETHLADLFDQLQGLSRRLLPKSITLEFVKPRADLKINIDPNQLITALINLLVNARDALDDKGLVVVDCQEVGVDSRSARLNGYSLEDGRYVEIRVKDNGPGVDRSIIDNVTTPFFTTKPVGKGSGLGLSMVEGFARQSGGGLLITSSSAGACFSVFLPISSAHNVASATLAT